jgi:membrane fusion protein (multidrug efflux system)
MSNASPSSPTMPRGRWRRWLVLLVLGLALAAGGLWAVGWLAYRFTHSISKDAFVDSHLINVAPQAAGTIVEMAVQEQTHVSRGQLLALVDPSIYQREVHLATARLAVAQAALAKAEADLALLTAEVPRRITIAQMKGAIARQDEAKAGEALEMVTRDVDKGVRAAQHAVEGARAGFVLAEEDYHRYSGLFKDGSVSERRFQEATKAYKTTQADVRVAEARLGQAEATRKQIPIAQRQLEAARHAVAEAEAVVELARLGPLQIEAGKKQVAERGQAVAEARRALELAQTNLGYTRVTAPYDGIVAKKWRHLGDYAHVGDPIFSLYNPQLLYVTVQLEETLLEGVAPGNNAELHIEAFRQPFRGRVLWVGSATGANFSLIPRDVSSGEFTYVVQRVPTRIAIDRDERWPLLKPGLSVTVAIEHGPGDATWAAEELRHQAVIEGVGEKQP